MRHRPEPLPVQGRGADAGLLRDRRDGGRLTPPIHFYPARNLAIRAMSRGEKGRESVCIGLRRPGLLSARHYWEPAWLTAYAKIDVVLPRVYTGHLLACLAAVLLLRHGHWEGVSPSLPSCPLLPPLP